MPYLSGVLTGILLTILVVFLIDNLGPEPDTRDIVNWDYVGTTLGTSVEKIGEEVREVHAAVDHGDQRAVEEELGDLLFAVANYARKLGVEPEAALRTASSRFQRRFTRMEEMARADGRGLASLSLDAQNALWERDKAEQATAPASDPAAH